MERASEVRERRDIGVNVTALQLRPDDPPTDNRASKLPFQLSVYPPPFPRDVFRLLYQMLREQKLKGRTAAPRSTPKIRTTAVYSSDRKRGRDE